MHAMIFSEETCLKIWSIWNIKALKVNISVEGNSSSKTSSWIIRSIWSAPPPRYFLKLQYCKTSCIQFSQVFSDNSLTWYNIPQLLWEKQISVNIFNSIKDANSKHRRLIVQHIMYFKSLFLFSTFYLLFRYVIGSWIVCNQLHKKYKDKHGVFSHFQISNSQRRISNYLYVEIGPSFLWTLQVYSALNPSNQKQP